MEPGGAAAAQWNLQTSDPYRRHQQGITRTPSVLKAGGAIAAGGNTVPRVHMNVIDVIGADTCYAFTATNGTITSARMAITKLCTQDAGVD